MSVTTTFVNILSPQAGKVDENGMTEYSYPPSEEDGTEKRIRMLHRSLENHASIQTAKLAFASTIAQVTSQNVDFTDSETSSAHSDSKNGTSTHTRATTPEASTSLFLFHPAFKSEQNTPPHSIHGSISSVDARVDEPTRPAPPPPALHVESTEQSPRQSLQERRHDQSLAIAELGAHLPRVIDQDDVSSETASISVGHFGSPDIDIPRHTSPKITREAGLESPELPVPLAETHPSPESDLILPAPLPPLEGYMREKDEISHDDSSTSLDTDSSNAAAAHPENAKTTEKIGFFERNKRVFRATYAPTVEPALVLPSAPTDLEKLCYLKTNRLPMYCIGVTSFLSLSAGMWLFVIAAVQFYWFSFFVGLMQIYLFISYAVSICGKDFDFEAHEKIKADNPIIEATVPSVDIYLPCCKEPMEVLENTYKHIKELKYPASKIQVWVLDDGGLDAVKALAESYGFNYICRDDRPRLKKAGNLRWAFARTTGDFFNIYDADFCPRPDFLLETIPQMMADPETAIIQTPQFFRTSDDQTWVEQGAGAVQELFYRLVQVNRNRWGASICVGSNALYRREALVEVGGTAEIGFSEDVHTGFYAVTRGWKVKYVPLCLACGICPDTPRAFFSQQMRWCMGSTTLLSNSDFWKSNLTVLQKICYLSGMMYYTAFALSIFLNPVPGIMLLWCRPHMLKYYNLAFVVPSIVYSLITFRLWAKASYSLNVQFVMVIQSYAYLTAIKDRICGTALAWVPSGDTKAHKNHKYRNMRILAWCWTITWQGALISGVTYRIITGIEWWNTVPLLILDTFNLFLAHRFLFCQT